MGSLPTIRQGSTAILNKHKGAWLGPASGDGSEPRATRRGSWHSPDRGAGTTCDVHLNTCDISVNVKACRSTETKTTRRKLERSQTFFCSGFQFLEKAHTFFFEASMILLTGPSPRHLSGKIFVKTPTEMPRSSSSEMRTETKSVAEPTIIPSATNLENQMPATHHSSEPTLVPGTDETQDRESPDMDGNR